MKSLRQWFGNRGIELEEGKLTYKVVKSKVIDGYLFLMIALNMKVVMKLNHTF